MNAVLMRGAGEIKSEPLVRRQGWCEVLMESAAILRNGQSVYEKGFGRRHDLPIID